MSVAASGSSSAGIIQAEPPYIAPLGHAGADPVLLGEAAVPAMPAAPAMPELRVRNTFLEFNRELWMLSEDAPHPRRASSHPPLGCDSAPGCGLARGSAGSSRGASPRSQCGEETDQSPRSEVEGRLQCGQERLSEADGGIGLGAPSAGSLLHLARRCKPCAFFHTKGCVSGAGCQFCHLCGPDEKRKRQKERWEQKRRQWRQFRKAERKERQTRRPFFAPGEPQALAT